MHGWMSTAAQICRAQQQPKIIQISDWMAIQAVCPNKDTRKHIKKKKLMFDMIPYISG